MPYGQVRSGRVLTTSLLRAIRSILAYPSLYFNKEGLYQLCHIPTLLITVIEPQAMGQHSYRHFFVFNRGRTEPMINAKNPPIKTGFLLF